MTTTIDKIQIQLLNFPTKTTVQEAIQALDKLRDRLDQNNRMIRLSAAKIDV